MCGIFAAFSHVTGVDYRKALDIVEHRGPDGVGLVNFECKGGEVVLGHRRLAIIDLDSHSDQPFSYMTRYWITYNGEIYNYIELRNELKSQGYYFSTSSDTEVLIVAYIEWGENMLSKLNGMFAFCIYDSYKKTIFVARDRFGIKPLYYFTSRTKGIFFASEIKQILALPISTRVLDSESMLSYVLYNDYEFNMKTMVSDISEFPEAHFLKIDLREDYVYDFSKMFVRWYNLKERKNGNRNTYTSDYHAQVMDAIRLRLRSDVKIGGLLSGGVDSSTIAVALSQLNANSVDLMTAKFSNSRLDESEYATLVANKLNLNLSIVNANGEITKDQIDKVTFFYDHPITGHVVFTHFDLYRAVSKNKIKVCLEGQGADESLMGYTGYQYAYMIRLLYFLKFPSFIKELVGFSRNENVSKKYIFKEITSRLLRLHERKEALANLQKYVNIDVRKVEHVNRKDRLLKNVEESRFRILKAILHCVDRSSMAHSVETRVPFLDHRLVELFLNAPFAEKIQDGYRKLILRKILSGKVPNSISQRPNKMGFRSPEGRWVKDHLDTYIRSYLENSNISNAINVTEVIKRYDRYLSGKEPYNRIFWRIFSVMKWQEVFNIS